ncbi:MAG: cytochrome c oxidase subunit 3 family protein [Acidobacteriota bacterium]
MSSAPAHPHAVHKDYQGAKLGMWLFLFTEILLFGGLFLLYSAYRAKYPLDFHNGGQHLNTFIGVANTVILLTSSLTVAVAVSAIQKGNKKLAMICLGTTIAFAFMFLVDKYIEWSAEIRHGIYPNGPALAKFPDGEKIFYGLYYCMTGLHGLHVLAGVVVLSVILDFVRREKITSADFTKLENAGLYWHLVDVIWIFLLPLLYLAA